MKLSQFYFLSQWQRELDLDHSPADGWGVYLGGVWYVVRACKYLRNYYITTIFTVGSGQAKSIGDVTDDVSWPDDTIAVMSTAEVLRGRAHGRV